MLAEVTVLFWTFLPLGVLAGEVIAFLYVAHSFHVRGWPKPVRCACVLACIFVGIVTSIHEYAHYNLELNVHSLLHEKAQTDNTWCKEIDGKPQRYNNGTNADCNRAKLTLMSSPYYDAWNATWARWTGLGTILGYVATYWMHVAGAMCLFFAFRYFYPAGSQTLSDWAAIYRMKQEMKLKSSLGAHELLKVVQ